MTAIAKDLTLSLARAIKGGQTLPQLPTNIDVDGAYRLQHEVTRTVSPGSIAGIKAGVTAKPVQQFLALDHALIASLYKDTCLASGAQLSWLEGRKIESEVALKVDDQGFPIAIAPALEIVSVRFSAPEQMTASNLLICNLGADMFVVGDFVPWHPKFNNLTMQLFCDDALVNQAPISAALGGPEPGAQWIHKEAINRGFKLSSELVFMMGACGAVVPGETGHYVGDYGALGKVELLIQ